MQFVQVLALCNLQQRKQQQLKTAKLLGGETLMSSHILCKFLGFFKENFYWCIGLKFSAITEIVMLFRYSEFHFISFIR